MTNIQQIGPRDRRSRAPAGSTDLPVFSHGEASLRTVAPASNSSPNLLESAATAISLARSAVSGEFPEDVHRTATKITEDLTLIACREHDRSLHRATTMLVTAIIEMSETDSVRREIWMRSLAPLTFLVRELHFALSKSMGLR